MKKIIRKRSDKIECLLFASLINSFEIGKLVKAKQDAERVSGLRQRNKEISLEIMRYANNMITCGNGYLERR